MWKKYMVNGFLCAFIWSIFNFFFSFNVGIQINVLDGYDLEIVEERVKGYNAYISGLITIGVLLLVCMVIFYFLGKWFLVHTHNWFTDMLSVFPIHVFFMLLLYIFSQGGSSTSLMSLIDWPIYIFYHAWRTYYSAIGYVWGKPPFSPWNKIGLSFSLTSIPYFVMLLGLRRKGKSIVPLAWKQKIYKLFGASDNPATSDNVALDDNCGTGR